MYSNQSSSHRNHRVQSQRCTVMRLTQLGRLIRCPPRWRQTSSITCSFSTSSSTPPTPPLPRLLSRNDLGGSLSDDLMTPYDMQWPRNNRSHSSNDTLGEDLGGSLSDNEIRDALKSARTSLRRSSSSSNSSSSSEVGIESAILIQKRLQSRTSGGHSL